MKNAEQEYRAALADFSQPGGRWNAKGRLTYWGKAAGLTAEEIVSDARAAGVTDRDADIRRGWSDAKPKGDHPQGGWRHYAPRAKPKPPPSFPRYVRDLVAAGGGEATSADITAISPYDFTHGRENGNPQLTTALFLRLFNPADLLFIDNSKTHLTGRPGENIRTADEWVRRVCLAGDMGGDLITPNPLTGIEGETTDGRKSFVARECVARYPFMVVEFDSMPLKVQAAFWRGILKTSPLGKRVAAVTYSGGKSLHGLLHVDAATLDEWQSVREQLRRLLAADLDPAFRADEQAMRPLTKVRLAGVRRRGNGRLQRLLYLNPEAVHPAKRP